MTQPVNVQVDTTDYRGIVVSGAVVFGALYLAAVFGLPGAWRVAILVALSAVIVTNNGAVFKGLNKTFYQLRKAV